MPPHIGLHLSRRHGGHARCRHIARDAGAAIILARSPAVSTPRLDYARTARTADSPHTVALSYTPIFWGIATAAEGGAFSAREKCHEIRLFRHGTRKDDYGREVSWPVISKSDEEALAPGEPPSSSSSRRSQRRVLAHSLASRCLPYRLIRSKMMICCLRQQASRPRGCVSRRWSFLGVRDMQSRVHTSRRALYAFIFNITMLFPRRLRSPPRDF